MRLPGEDEDAHHYERPPAALTALPKPWVLVGIGNEHRIIFYSHWSEHIPGGAAQEVS